MEKINNFFKEKNKQNYIQMKNEYNYLKEKKDKNLNYLKNEKNSNLKNITNNIIVGNIMFITSLLVGIITLGNFFLLIPLQIFILSLIFIIKYGNIYDIFLTINVEYLEDENNIENLKELIHYQNRTAKFYKYGTNLFISGVITITVIITLILIFSKTNLLMELINSIP